MTQIPELSVVMGVNNGEDDLEATLESILSQSGCVFELIVVDDGSTDRTTEILAHYASQDDRLRVLRQEHQGLTRALISGCEAANGRYIARHDVGDSSHPDRLRLQQEALDSDDELAFVSCWTQFSAPRGEPLYVSRGNGQARRPIRILSDEPDQAFVDGPSCHPSVVFRKDAYQRAGGYREEFYYGQDWDLWGRLAEQGTFQMLETVLYTAQVAPTGISTQGRLRQRALGKLQHEAVLLRRKGESDAAVLERARTIRPSPSAETSRRSVAAGNYFIGSCLIENGNPAGLAYLRQALRHNPLSLKCWRKLIRGYWQRRSPAAQ